MIRRLRFPAAAAAALLGALGAAPALAQGGGFCPPDSNCPCDVQKSTQEVVSQFQAKATDTVVQETVKEPNQAIVDLNCIELPKMPTISVLFNADGVLDQLLKDIQKKACNAANDMIKKTTDKALGDFAGLADKIPQFPGLEVTKGSTSALGGLNPFKFETKPPPTDIGVKLPDFAGGGTSTLLDGNQNLMQQLFPKK